MFLGGNMLKKTTQLKQMLHSPQVEFLMGAHDGLSARIAEEAGFAGIWASGLCISAAMGIRDSNEASWTQVLEVTEFMSDATTIPILLDADTGYGNFNNVRRLVRKLEQRNVAGVCIEDKLFPKANSFVKGAEQALADIDEFSGKIRAAKDTQQDEDFCVVARTEAFISGQGLDAVLERANAYYEAGADAILVHSKISTADQIIAFMREWHGRCPIVIVPTTYVSTPTQVFAENGVSLVIWANHLLRSIITTMQEVAARMHVEQTPVAIEQTVASVQEVFRLQNMAELEAAEKRYLPMHPNGRKPVPFATPVTNGVEYISAAAD
jgi:phosphoenolpyruvate phosphomutase